MSSSWKSAFRRARVAIAVVLAALVVILVRVLTASHAELTSAESYYAKGDVDAAVVHFRRAAKWYAPASPYPPKALERLGEIALAAESRGDTDLALASWRAIRGAILSTRSFYTPFPSVLDAANRRIASLMAAQPPPPVDAGKTPDQLRGEHLELLEQDLRPDQGWTIVLLLGFALWLIASFLFMTRAFDEEDRWVAPEACRWGFWGVVGFVTFALGLTLA